MPAVRCHFHGPPGKLSLDAIETPAPGEQEVLLKIRAASINFPDGLQIRGKYQFQPEMPFIPGSDYVAAFNVFTRRRGLGKVVLEVGRG